jgi:RNA polymerase-associated protein RTF1
MKGGGKQIRIQTEEDDSDDDNSSENEDMLDTQPTYARPSPIGGGKQFRPSGGKQFHHVAQPEESEESSDDESEPEPIVYNRGTGKSLQRMGKQLRRPTEPEVPSSENDQDEEEEKSEPIRVTHNPRGGKMLRPFNPSPEDEDSMSIDDSEEEEEEQEEAAPPPTTKRSTRTTTRARTSQKKEVDDMEESSEDSSDDDFDSEEEQELDMETFNYNRLIEDEADQKMLDSLPEIERESILAERFEKFKNAADMKKALRENKRQERERKRLESGKKAKGTKGKKVAKKGTKANKKNDTSKDAEIAKGLTFSRVAKNKDVTGVKAKRKAALEQLRKDRAEATIKNDDEESDLDYGDDNDDDSDDDEDYAEEVKPWQKKKKSSRLASLPIADDDVSDDDERQEDKRRVQKVFVEAGTTDYAKVTIPRRRLIRWCNEPFFEQAVLNFYVRVAIGRDKLTQRPCYRLCKIVGIVSKKEQYTIDDQSNQYPKAGKAIGKAVSTNPCFYFQCLKILGDN